MNPDAVIRPWLLGCGAPFGARHAHPYRWPDVSTRPETPYFTYRPVSASPDFANGFDQIHEIKNTYDAISTYQQHWTLQIQVDLFNSASGMSDLAGCAIAAKVEQSFLNLFVANNAAFSKVVSISDMTEEDAERIYYHQRMVCEWYTYMVYRHENINHVVTSVVLDDPFGVD